MQTARSINIALSFACGLYFALLQFSYFFLMEAYLSSQYLSYFITLLFWLCGFLVGLNLSRKGWFTLLLAVGLMTYYLTWLLTRFIPFHTLLYPAAAICSVISGLLPGYFFPFMSPRFNAIKSLLLHENNGFILGILIALKASIHFGNWFLTYIPALGAMIVILLFLSDGTIQMLSLHSLNEDSKQI